MLFPSLLGHAAELFRIVRKSPQPADALASDYFRSKKYIGSKERRFLSEVVFAALRTALTAEHCARAAGIPAEVVASSGGRSVDPVAAGTVAAACLLGEALGSMHSADALSAVPGTAVGSADDLLRITGDAWAHLMQTTPEAGRAWAEAVLHEWRRVEREANRLLDSGGPANERELATLAVRWCAQPWMLQAWHDDAVNTRTWSDVGALALSLLPPAPLCLRVNTMLMSREEALRRLHAEGIDAGAGALSPAAIVCRKRVDIRRLDLVTGGVLEVQDEASQLVGYGVSPDEDWRVLDACAGAGGKSLHIAVLQHDRGEVIASDIEFKRLKEVAYRASRSGLSSIRTVPLDRRTPTGDLPRELARYRNRCDAVVVDAPCSGMGTVRRMPLPKWRLTPDLLARHAAKQLAVLSTYAACVRPGGVLLYSTCSIMPRENDGVVQAFLREHPAFVPEPLAPILARHGVSPAGVQSESHTLTLTPAVHGTDGFFLARMRKSTE